MKKAYIFPGQGSQFSGMGKEISEKHSFINDLFDEANAIIGFNLKEIMFNGTDEELKKTNVTQPAIFLHSIGVMLSLGEDFKPDAVAGHSLGEFSSLVACKALDWKDAFKLVIERANAMQTACEINPSTMAAILGADDDVINDVCSKVDGVVVPANFNCPGQVVISGSFEAIDIACEELLKVGAKRAIKLSVGGAFHSPLMQPAQEKFNQAIDSTTFNSPICPIYQNVDGLPYTDVAKIKENLKQQLVSAVLWKQTIENMVQNNINNFYELGPGKVLQGLVKKIAKDSTVESFS
jgi:[acyl-carrier-protein] S-malonyltransferase